MIKAKKSISQKGKFYYVDVTMKIIVKNQLTYFWLTESVLLQWTKYTHIQIEIQLRGLDIPDSFFPEMYLPKLCTCHTYLPNACHCLCESRSWEVAANNSAQLFAS